MSDQATERVFQNDIITQIRANGWQLVQVKNAALNFVCFLKKVVGFFANSNAQLLEFKALNRTTPHKR